MNGRTNVTSNSSKQLAPFTVDEELDKSLKIENGQLTVNDHVYTKYTPHLPGQPTMPLRQNEIEVQHFLQNEVLTPRLDEMSPHLWLMTTQSYKSVTTLHGQVVCARRIVITEDPELHLCWVDDQVFVKPIPPYLMSHAIWTSYLDPSTSVLPDVQTVENLRRAILGYLRSWTLLIRHQSDYTIAINHNLLPVDTKYSDFMHFIKNFDDSNTTDEDVSPRYRFGELRLSRLNFWVKILLRQWMFHTVHWQKWQYFATFYGPLLFIFAVCSVVLSAMQVGLATTNIWNSFDKASKWFSITTLLIVAFTSLLLILLLIIMLSIEWTFALKARLRKRRK